MAGQQDTVGFGTSCGDRGIRSEVFEDRKPKKQGIQDGRAKLGCSMRKRRYDAIDVAATLAWEVEYSRRERCTRSGGQRRKEERREDETTRDVERKPNGAKQVKPPSRLNCTQLGRAWAAHTHPHKTAQPRSLGFCLSSNLRPLRVGSADGLAAADTTSSATSRTLVLCGLKRVDLNIIYFS